VENLTFLHVGSGGLYFDGLINSDMRSEWRGKKHKLDLIMPLHATWPYKTESVDGIVGMHVFQQLQWRELLIAFQEAYRVLKTGGVLRMGLPMVEVEERPLDLILGWNNVNLFSFDLLERVLVDRLGFKSLTVCEYQESQIKEFEQVDNKREQSWYLEAVK
jgi:Methyltransferase domain